MSQDTDALGLVLAVVATVVGLRLGLSGPDVSPVFTELPLGAVPGGTR